MAYIRFSSVLYIMQTLFILHKTNAYFCLSTINSIKTSRDIRSLLVAYICDGLYVQKQFIRKSFIALQSSFTQWERPIYCTYYVVVTRV